uniref:Elongation of very long chain fatty acids protein n=1 Tax=Equus asinus TaxID=9793 RepID=A0A8C4PHX7_EQUAS|nr:elongation of very long chain fatty acids protein 6 isoform X1 [Equus asinus]XP_044623326.1 elongation of very long chain fatty acids protein 6 isoform X1 [Equus asinus]
MNMSVLTLQEYEFEKQFNENEAIQWMQENWKKSFLFSALYAAFIFGGRHLMNKRAKFELRTPLVLWSLTLAVFSIFGALRTGAYMVYILMTKGLKQSVCDQSFYNGPISKFWAYAFVLSKAPELGDTIFIILRKQKLIFLHWYHHITVLLYSWYSYKDMVAGGGWFMTMNFSVHALMYSYYALRAAGFRVSRKFAMFITLSQITQMLWTEVKKAAEVASSCCPRVSLQTGRPLLGVQAGSCLLLPWEPLEDAASEGPQSLGSDGSPPT